MNKALRRAAVLGVLVAAGVAGCTSHEYYPLRPHLIQVRNTRPLTEFRYQPTPGDVTLARPGPHIYGYRTRHFSMPASYKNGQPGDLVTGTYYYSGLPGKKPLVIVLPVWGVSEYPSTRMTYAILKRSDGKMNVLRVEGDNRLMTWKKIAHSGTVQDFVANVADYAQRFRHAVIDVRRLIDWAQTRHEIAGNRIGLVGFSVSAIVGTMVVESDPRIKSSALVMGGADIASIMAHCQGSEADARNAVMRNLGLSREDYEKTVSALFQGLDPSDYPDRVNPASVLIVTAAKDRCIPRKARDDWWVALGKPARIAMNYGHRESFLAMTPLGFDFLRARVYDHLAATL